jgi:hypothetical protein
MKRLLSIVLFVMGALIGLGGFGHSFIRGALWLSAASGCALHQECGAEPNGRPPGGQSQALRRRTAA